MVVEIRRHKAVVTTIHLFISCPRLPFSHSGEVYNLFRFLTLFISMKPALQLPKLQSNQTRRIIPCFNASSFSLVQNTNVDNIAFPEASKEKKSFFPFIVEAENKHFEIETYSSVNKNVIADIY